MRRVTPWEPRFWSHVEKGAGCWRWRGLRDKDGYGILWIGGRKDGRNARAHRLSWQIANGTPPSLHVLHRCDNPQCVNPEHLFLGTNADNVRDRNAKGRANFQHGTRNGHAKLNDVVVRQMRAERASGDTVRVIAERHGVSLVTAWQALVGKTWRHVT